MPRVKWVNSHLNYNTTLHDGLGNSKQIQKFSSIPTNWWIPRQEDGKFMRITNNREIWITWMDDDKTIGVSYDKAHTFVKFRCNWDEYMDLEIDPESVQFKWPNDQNAP